MIDWLPGKRPIRSGKWGRHLTIGLLSKTAISLLCVAAFAPPQPVLIYNASRSVPLGFYRIAPLRPLKTGDLVLLHTPDNVRQLADDRHYLPKTVPMLKHIAALSGDTVCAFDQTITINGARVAERQARDTMGRPMPQWAGCQTLTVDDVFLLNPEVPQSFDGRYFGVVKRTLILGRVVPL